MARSTPIEKRADLYVQRRVTDAEIEALADARVPRRMPAEFSDFVDCLTRPYIRISDAQYVRLREISGLPPKETGLGPDGKFTDIFIFDGKPVTHGYADGGYALMPVRVPLNTLEHNDCNG